MLQITRGTPHQPQRDVTPNDTRDLANPVFGARSNNLPQSPMFSNDHASQITPYSVTHAALWGISSDHGGFRGANSFL